MRELRVQQPVLEQQLRPELGVEPGVQPRKPRLVHRELTTEAVEAGGRQTELRSVERLPVRRLREGVTHSEDPCGVGMLLRNADLDSDIVDSLVPRTHADRAAYAVAAVGSIHQVHEVLPRGE